LRKLYLRGPLGLSSAGLGGAVGWVACGMESRRWGGTFRRGSFWCWPSPGGAVLTASLPGARSSMRPSGCGAVPQPQRCQLRPQRSGHEGRELGIAQVGQGLGGRDAGLLDSADPGQLPGGCGNAEWSRGWEGHEAGLTVAGFDGLVQLDGFGGESPETGELGAGGWVGTLGETAGVVLQALGDLQKAREKAFGVVQAGRAGKGLPGQGEGGEVEACNEGSVQTSEGVRGEVALGDALEGGPEPLGCLGLEDFQGVFPVCQVGELFLVAGEPMQGGAIEGDRRGDLRMRRPDFGNGLPSFSSGLPSFGAVEEEAGEDLLSPCSLVAVQGSELSGGEFRLGGLDFLSGEIEILLQLLDGSPGADGRGERLSGLSSEEDFPGQRFSVGLLGFRAGRVGDGCGEALPVEADLSEAGAAVEGLGFLVMVRGGGVGLDGLFVAFEVRKDGVGCGLGSASLELLGAGVEVLLMTREKLEMLRSTGGNLRLEAEEGLHGRGGFGRPGRAVRLGTNRPLDRLGLSVEVLVCQVGELGGRCVRGPANLFDASLQVCQRGAVAGIRGLGWKASVRAAAGRRSWFGVQPGRGLKEWPR